MKSDLKDKVPWFLLMVIFLASLVFIAGGMSFYKTLERRTLDQKENELSAIATLKVGEISKWRAEHLRDGIILSRDLPLIRSFAEFIRHENNEKIRAEILIWMHTFIKDYDYHSIFFLDTTRTILLAWPDDIQATGDSLVAPASDVSDLSKIYFSDLHLSPDLKGIHLDLVIPLYPEADISKARIGSIVLRIDPEIFLFPLIQSWPAQSESSETIILRSEGDSIVYLNELKHLKNTALKLRFSLSNNNLPAVRAAKGFEGPFNGVDYRNVKVLSYLKKIPDSPWYMVTKIDKNEIYTPLNEQLFLISLIIILLIVSIIMMVGYSIRNQRIKIFRELNSNKDKFFSIISHDLKAPFVSIVGYTELLDERIKKKDFNDTGKFTSIILESSYGAMSLLANLIEWSRIQSGRMKPNFQPVDLCRIIEESVLLLHGSSTQKSISIIREMPEKIYIQADTAMISTVVRNLISNSIKFSYENSLIIVSATERENDIMTVIKDFGIGIEKQVLEKLFLAESTLSIPGTRNEAGTALGLIICKEFISMHNGEIWAQSDLGKGSTFSFTIPKNKGRELKTS